MHHRTSVRQIALSASLVAVVVALSMGVGTWAVEGDAAQTDRVTDESSATKPGPAGVPTNALPGRPPSQLLQQVRERRLRVAARAAERAREERQARQAREVREQQLALQSASRSYAGDPKRIAAGIMADRYGWDGNQFSCLAALWGKESGWDVHAANASGAYGIPQALPGSKMSAYGSDWRDNPVTQIEWGLAYIDDSYGTPCGAWSAFQSKGWY